MKYCILIDCQNDFLTGALKNDAAVAKIPAIVEKVKELKAKGFKVIATRDTHFNDYLQTQEGKNLPVPHCIENTKGWEVTDELKPFVDKYIDKTSFGYEDWGKDSDWDVEEGKDYDETIPEEIHMMGTVTEICVLANAIILKAAYPEVPIYVHKDLCAGLNHHEEALKCMESQQIKVI